ncbi:4-hydroxybenzoate octaprenyltransferase [Corticibacter populi]|uniref:4-hydroxybenzoate octaprenyltransferase n=1 Tax=Corticibacter populi TaxID=1550736 RepID=A0A3M6QZ68_9BURK|nr:4-hydroxybenzoate octaprenyltransferase [Corticibacter populi]RMX07929.1 4-hydroxybenzoate octaprenyltransferase [Corticibacter populi]RZS35168.1 4-hydroxybenzoate polyprenyltransferase [Corticibacter populi]
MPTSSLAPSSLAMRLHNYLDLIRWSRPAGWLLLLWPTLSALWLAANGFPGWHLLLVFTAGTVLMRSAGCCVNDVADREFDRHVQRTSERPITSGRTSVKEALMVALVLTLVAFALVLTTNAKTVYWSFFAVAITVLYPYTKRFFSMPQAVLGLAFSIGIPMAFTAVRQQVPAEVWWLLAGNLFWVIAYDTEYAMVDRDDDLKIGIKTSAITLGRWDVAGIMACYALLLLCWAWGLRSYQLGWPFHLALALAVLQIGWHGWLIRTRERNRCFRAFTQNHWIGFTLFAGIAVALALR